RALRAALAERATSPRERALRSGSFSLTRRQNSTHGGPARFTHPRHYHRQALLQEPIEPACWLLRGARPHQPTGTRRASRTQCRFGERKVNKVALGEAATTAMGDVAHACQPVNARSIVAAGEGKQRFAEERCECILRECR